MAVIDNVVEVVEKNPLLVVGGTLGAVFLFTLMGRGGGGSEVARVMPEHTLQSQKIAADTNVALAQVQAQREQSYVSLSEVAAARDVGLYQAAVQANLGKQATDAQIAGYAYEFAGLNTQAKTAIAINQIQADTVDNQTRAMLATNLAGITAGYVANRDNLSLQAKALDVSKAINFREQQTIQSRDTLQASNQALAINAGRDVAIKTLDLQAMTNSRYYDALPAIMQHEGNLAVLEGNLINNQIFSAERIAEAGFETQQYIAKKATKAGILGNIISGGFGLANNLIGAIK